jgi:hypothetical protein
MMILNQQAATTKNNAPGWQKAESILQSLSITEAYPVQPHTRITVSGQSIIGESLIRMMDSVLRSL